MSKDKSEKERYRLGQEIIKLENKEEDFVSLTNQHEERVANLFTDFRHLSFEIETLLYNLPETNSNKYHDLQANQGLNHQMESYVNQHLEELSQTSRTIRRQLDDNREDLIKERNSLPWE